jgi:hypothetical protein
MPRQTRTPDQSPAAKRAAASGARPRLGTAAVATVLLAIGCGTSVSETYINDPPATMAPRGRSSVRIYASGPPARPHMDVAILEAVQSHGLNEQGTNILIDSVRSRAARLGCDGVVVGGIRERDGSPPGSGFYLLDPGATTLHATCIVFTDKAPPAASRKPPAPPAPPAPSAPATPADSALRDDGSCRAP